MNTENRQHALAQDVLWANPAKPRPAENPHRADYALFAAGAELDAGGAGRHLWVMVLVGQVPALCRWQMGAILGSITFTAVVTCWVLVSANKVCNALGETDIRILVRIMGLLLVALAMQYFVNGIRHLWMIPRHWLRPYVPVSIALCSFRFPALLSTGQARMICDSRGRYSFSCCKQKTYPCRCICIVGRAVLLLKSCR